MNHRFCLRFFLLALLCLSQQTFAQVVNLTPWPLEMTQKQGQFVLPQRFPIKIKGLDENARNEVLRFATELNQTTGIKASLSQRKAVMTITRAQTAMDDEGYRLTIHPKGINIEVTTTTGLFYALQSIKKMLPGNVAAGVSQPGQTYALPLVNILDAPRFHYRGFMLDVSRHFFTTDEIKKFLRLMATYKMNYFHWHLTDDQGWRVEIKKYPKLTSVGSIRNNSWNTDINKGSYYTNKPYGPYFYTQEEIRDIVAYAAQLHITVVPEIEMPGHLAAAMASYPEYSCNPNGKHNVWVDGGISTDVLNVANPKAVEFAKDILTELAPLFPGEMFHVGGDETPTTAWEHNAECQALYKAEGMTSYSQLQSRFTKEIAQHLKTLGKRIVVWNEAITAKGADTQLIKESEATVFSWNPCQRGARMAAELGLKVVVSNWGKDGCYYINRRANSKDFGAGTGGDNLQLMYDYLPVPANTPSELQPYFYGVQGTFWCEHVSEPEHLEHLALPRLMGIAEAGWTPQNRKDFQHFVNRMKEDRTYLRLAGFRYHPQYLDYDGPEPPSGK